jgi:hypothetical protein
MFIQHLLKIKMALITKYLLQDINRNCMQLADNALTVNLCNLKTRQLRQ